MNNPTYANPLKNMSRSYKNHLFHLFLFRNIDYQGDNHYSENTIIEILEYFFVMVDCEDAYQEY